MPSACPTASDSGGIAHASGRSVTQAVVPRPGARPVRSDRRLSLNGPVRALRVPPGHPLAGQPLCLPDYGEAFLRDALTVRERASCASEGKMPRAAITAVFLLGRLVGPLAFNGYRAGVASVSKEKAGELKTADARDRGSLEARRASLPSLTGARAR